MEAEDRPDLDAAVGNAVALVFVDGGPDAKVVRVVALRDGAGREAELATELEVDQRLGQLAVLDEDRQSLEEVFVLITLPTTERDDSSETVRPDQGRTDGSGRCRIEVPPGRPLIANVWFLSGIAQMDPEVWFKGDAGDGAAEIEALIEQRVQAKKDKNFAEADRIRDALKDQGVILEDKPGGVTEWRRA